MTNLPATISSLIDDLSAAKASTPQVSSGDFLYLKMTKTGEWIYGAEEQEVSSTSAFAVEPASYSQGFVAWNDGVLVDEHMAVAGQAPITMGDLPALPAGIKWDSQVAFALKGIEGADDGVQLLYKVSSRGGKQAVSDLLAKTIERGKEGHTDLCPVVLLDNSSYKHKKYGKIYTPVLTVDEWVDIPAGDEPVAKVGVSEPEPEPKPEPEPAPKRTRRTRRSK